LYRTWNSRSLSGKKPPATSHWTGTLQEIEPMDAQERPTTELAELHQLFLKLRHETVDSARRRLAFEIVLHPAGEMRLKAACGAVLGRASHDLSLRSDILQAATVRLVERLTQPGLAYLDESADEFGGWLYSMCRSCCFDAWESERSPWVGETSVVDPDQLLNVAASPYQEPLWIRLLRMIGALDDPMQRIVLLHCLAGFDVNESADRLGLSARTVNRLRHEGCEVLRRIVAEELIDNC
jgi:DNA-directed RNA polymerase specialized sigma24 family protein